MGGLGLGVCTLVARAGVGYVGGRVMLGGVGAWVCELVRF